MYSWCIEKLIFGKLIIKKANNLPINLPEVLKNNAFGLKRFFAKFFVNTKLYVHYIKQGLNYFGLTATFISLLFGCKLNCFWL